MELGDLYRRVVETSPDGIWVVGLDGATVFANPEIARIHGVEESALDSLTVFDTLDEAGRVQFAAHLEDVRAGRTNQAEVEVQWVRHDGTIVWVLCRESALRDAEGRTTALLHRYTDYTERRAILESLRASEDALEDQIAQNTLMQAVASAANEARSLVDVLRHARSLVLLHDDWERARAFVPGETTGRLVPFYADESDREQDADDPRAADELALAQRCYDEDRLVWDDAMLTVAFPIPHEDEIHAVLVITSAPPLYRFEMIENMATRVAEQLSRVVERERYQAALAAARDAAMVASQQKSDFLATMSHEIRTPLNGVIGLNDLLMRTELSTEQQRLVSGVQLASRTLLDLINDILDFSKIEAGRLELEELDFEVRPLLENVAGLLTEAARDKALDLVVSVHPDVPAVLAGDPTRLAQVVTNLVSNAVKFTERGGVVVRATVDEPGPDEAGTEGGVRLRVAVSDTGVGVAPEKLRALFEPFTQADSSTTRVYGGTGLGLAISLEIVEAMGGRLEHEPHEGGGSVFTFTAHLGEARGDAHPVTYGAEALGGPQLALTGRRALVVDDTGADRRPLAEHLAWWGVEVERLGGLDELRERMEGEGPVPDVVVLDLADPRRAAEAAAIVRAGHERTGVLLVCPVGVGAPEPEPAGVDAVLSRPVRSAMLLDALRLLVAGPPAAGPVGSVGSVVSGSPADAVPTASKGWILVVEDNPVNQMVATGLLAALGYTTDTAADGLAAIEAARTGGFDAILMDVQMPHMDGYTATERIRATENGPRRPIIAMTAAAVEGERERCLAAGMDDFLTKPVDAARLAETLDRWLRPGTTPPSPTTPSPTTQPEPEKMKPRRETRLDTDRLAELREVDLPGAVSYVARAIDNFLTKAPQDLETMASAIAADDDVALRAVAHRFAGAALNLGAPGAGEAARDLEHLAKDGEMEQARALLPRVEAEVEADLEALRSYLGATFPAVTG